MAFLQKCKAGSAPVGAVLSIESPLSAYLMSSAGYDWVLIDMEHTPHSAREMTAMVHAVANGSEGNCSSLVRIPALGVEWVKWALDAGANGVVAPMLQSKEEAERLVRYAKYPPVGQRSFGPFNAPWAQVGPNRSVQSYVSNAMKPGNIAVIAMIESRDGITNAEDIISTEGIDGIFIGPVDMRLSLGLAGADGPEEEFMGALQKILDLCKKHGKVVGIYSATPASVKKQVGMGFDYLLTGGDSTVLTAGAKASLEGIRGAVKDAKL